MKKPNKYHNASKIVKAKLAQKADMVVPNKVYSSKQLTSSEKWALMAIYSFADENKQTVASNEMLGEKLGLTAGSMGQRVFGLVEKGYITKETFCTELNPETRGTKIRLITIL